LTETVRVSTPCRADLAGGTLDIWPLGVLHPGAVTVNLAIPVRVELEIDLNGVAGEMLHALGEGPPRRLTMEDSVSDLSAAVAFSLVPGGGVRAAVRSQAAIGSGLGGSSAYAVALARGVLLAAGRRLADEALVRLLCDLEARVLGAPTGAQDHWAAVRGGVLALHLDAGGNRVEKLEVPLGWISERMTVFDTGITHHSGMVNWQVVRRRLDGDAAAAGGLEAIADAARRCRRSLLDLETEAVGEAIADEWSARRALAPEVSPPDLESLVRTARAAGAMAAKACGAGGGGSLVMWHHPGARQDIVAALCDAAPGGATVASGVEIDGCRAVVCGRR
jgi:D-glycero-alpha-D-manno-heptose-7-phosphate kinase